MCNTGKLASAELLVLGSVEKFGTMYHVNARMVRTETGEILATAYDELPVSAFEREAKDYVTLVPETQSIGIYLLYNYRKMNGASGRVFTDGSTTINRIPRDIDLNSSGIGLRYMPRHDLILDVAMTHHQGEKKLWKDLMSNTSGNWTTSANQKLTTIRAIIGLTTDPAKTFSGFAGAGATSIKAYSGGTKTYVTPTILIRGEYHPQQRIGISLTAGYDTRIKSLRNESWLMGDTGVGHLTQLYGESSVSVYF